MRLLSYLAVVSAVLWSASADACCFLKCFGHSAADNRTACEPRSDLLKIYLVDGKSAPDGIHFGIVSSGQVTILVDAEDVEGREWIEVTLVVEQIRKGDPIKPDSRKKVYRWKQERSRNWVEAPYWEYSFSKIELEAPHSYSATATGTYKQSGRVEVTSNTVYFNTIERTNVPQNTLPAPPVKK